MKPIIFIIMSLGVSFFANAANKYVRSGATGTNTGADWTNAHTVLPAVLVRGDTYYIADGDYAAYTFDDAQSGTSVITIKKAIASDHGTDTGWQSAYGDGQAIFSSTLVFKRGFYVFDGQTRNESDWFDGNAYGFRIAHNNKDQNIIISDYGFSINSVSIKYVFVDAIRGNLPAAQTIRRYAIDTDGFDGGSVGTNLVFHRMYVSGSNNVWFLRTTNGAIVEYSASDGVVNTSANHGEIVNLYYSGNNAVVRYNKFRNAYLDAGGGGTALVAITYADGLQFYGNIAWDFSVGDGAVGYNGANSSHNRIYNNTFINCRGYNGGMVWGSGTDNIVYNNLWVNCPTVTIQGTHNYNAFSDGNSRGEANAQINVPTSIFTNYAAGDYSLKTATLPGTNLNAPFDIDILGRTRGADKAWDRGAFELNSGVSSTGKKIKSTPTTIRVTQ